MQLHLVSSLLFALVSGAVVAQEPTPQEPAPQEPASEPSAPDTAARIFVNRCTGCHTVGRGNLTGPDLKASTGWAEPDLRLAIEKMFEKSGSMTEDEVSDLIELLKDPEIDARMAAEEERIALQYAATLAPPSPKEGEALFYGHTSLSAGGMACVACHRVGGERGGALGTDLQTIFEKTGETGLRSACEKAQFPVMAAAYRQKPITKQEAMHLVAFFGAVGATTPDGLPSGGIAAAGTAPSILGLGAALSLAVLLITAAMLRNRHSNSRRVLRRRNS